MSGVTRGWPPARRRKQAENARKFRPWLQSTGPRTTQGKARTRLNAQKHGFRSAEWRALYHALHAHRQFLKLALPLLGTDNPQQFQRIKRDLVRNAALNKLEFCNGLLWILIAQKYA